MLVHAGSDLNILYYTRYVGQFIAAGISLPTCLHQTIGDKPLEVSANRLARYPEFVGRQRPDVVGMRGDIPQDEFSDSGILPTSPPFFLRHCQPYPLRLSTLSSRL